RLVVRPHRAGAHRVRRRRAPRAGARADGDAIAGAPGPRARGTAAQGPEADPGDEEMMMQHRGADQLLLPVNPLFLWLSLFAALVFNMLPLGRIAALPDMLALVLVFWNVHQPRRVGIGAAFFFGLLMDVHQGAVLGQHAEAYTLLSFLAITMH